MATWRRKTRDIALGTVAGLLTLVLIAVLLLTQTDWGRRHVLAFGLDQLASRVHGNVTIGGVYGNLLTGARLVDVVITDTAGRPFLRADTVELRYSMTSLARKHLVLSDVRVVRGLFVLDQPPGEDWNFNRIFPTGEPDPKRGPGFGAWVNIEDMSVRNSTVIVRANIDDPKTAGRKWVVPVGDGYQSISEFLSVNARFPLMRLADPDSVNRLILVDSLSMFALPFLPPGVRVLQTSARAVITRDSVLIDRMRFQLPGTRGTGAAAYAINGTGMRVQLALPEASFADGRFFRPDAPPGNGSLSLAFTTHRGATHVIASDMDLRSEGATIRGLADFTTGNNRFTVGPSDVSFANVDTRTILRYAPDLPLTAGTLAGHMKLAGEQRSMAVNGDVRFTERRGPTSHIVADGRIGERNGVLTANALRLRFQPLHLSLLRKYEPRVPYRGALTGTATFTGNTRDGFALVADVVSNDPAAGRSHVLANGRVEARDGFTARNLRLRFEPLQVAMLEPFARDLPYGGTLSGTTTLSGSPRRGFDVIADLVHNSNATGRSHVTANGWIGIVNGLSTRALRLGFDPLQVAVLEPFTPKKIPYGGTLNGTTTLTGSQRNGFNVIADVVHNSDQTGRSHVTANGWVGLVNGLSARALRLGFEPLQVAAIRPFAPQLPFDGALAGTATVTGSLTAQRVAAVLDLEHAGSTGYSHAIGRANLRWGRGGSYDVDLRLPALSLATVGRFAPALGLRGSASGTVVARGAASNVSTDLDLALADSGGRIHTRGTFDLSDGLRHYDFTSTVTAFNAAAATSRAPRTLLNGVITARGAGTDPATAEASVDARLFGSRAAGTPLVDTAVVRARVGNGLATIDTGHVRLSSARGDFAGSFGLVANRSGTLRYSFEVDTLAQFVGGSALDTVFVRPRPLVQARRIAQARADSARIAQATEVQRAAVGYPPPPALVADTVAAIRRDTIRGSLRAEGTLTGNVKRFGTQGNAEARGFAYRGNYVGAGRAEYDLRDFGTTNATLKFNAFGDTVRLSGFAFDSVRATANYLGERNRGAGSADLAFYQDPQRDYRVRSDFNLSLEEKRIALQTLDMRFDTTRWQATHPAVVSWGKPGVIVDNLEMRSNAGGTLRADGRLPTDGRADMRLDIEGLQLADISGLLQDTMSIEGLLGLHAKIEGTAEDPSISGNLSVFKGRWGTTVLPDVRGTLAYADRDLTTHFELFRDSTRLALADAHLPINLALKGVTGPRLLRDLPLQADIRADSLPLEALPNLTTVVADVRGRVRGNATIRGTVNEPRIDGLAQLDLGSLRVVPTGVLYNDIVGNIRLRGDTAYVDSIVAHAHGTVRTSGTINFATLARPGFNLQVAAQDAVLVDNERGRIRADATLEVAGPYEAVHVTGDMHLARSVIYLPETVNTRVTNLEDPTLRSTLDTAALGLAQLPRRNPLLAGLKVDIGVTIAPDTWARNLQANVEVYTPEDEPPLQVHMDNANQVLTLTGIINADRGEYTYAGRSFQLSTGSATFLPGPTIDPFLNLTAQYEVQRDGAEALLIGIHVDGNLTKPRVTLQSNSQPPLSQSDLLSYLAFGQSSSSVLNTETVGIGNGGLTGLPALAQQQLASLAIGATVDQVVAEIEQEGTRNGLDVFRVHAGALPPEATFESYFTNVFRGTEIEAGKYLSDRFFAAARGRFNTWPGVSLEYRGQLGLTWTAVWEPRYMPTLPSLTSVRVQQKRSLGVLMLWQRRF